MLISLLCSGSSAYLLIAQPQSSSTSAMLSLSDMIAAHRKQDFFCLYNASMLHCPVYGQRFSPGHPLHAFNEHSDSCDTKPWMISRWASAKTTVFKQHLTPITLCHVLKLDYVQKLGPDPLHRTPALGEYRVRYILPGETSLA